MNGGERAAGYAPLPAAGEFVQLQAAGADHVGLYRARVRAVGLRRILLETAEAVTSTGDGFDDGMSALPARTALVLSFARGDALYQFETRVVGPSKAGGVTVARPRQVTRVQRRRFYRLPLESPTTFRVLSEDGRASSAPLAGRLVNLSGGGALLAGPLPILSGHVVILRVPAGKEGYSLDLEAECLDCRIVTRGAARVYLARLRFFDPPRLAEEDREAIIAYIYEQQRILLRNRKLLRS